jgi:hypothetical protein
VSSDVEVNGAIRDQPACDLDTATLVQTLRARGC